jgi:exodeoxyribonuclease X
MIIRTFDVETTGFPEEGKPSAIIQLGWTDVEYNDRAGTATVIKDPMQVFCNPFRANPKLRIDIGAKATHHIEEDDVKDAMSPDAALMLLVDGADAFACHNKEHDGHYFTGYGKPFICTLKAAKVVWPDAERHSNQFLRYLLKLPVDRDLATPAHEAGPDSYVTAHLLATIINEGASLSDMIEWTNGPILQKVLRFGNKHRGKTYEEVPTDYLRWMVDNADLDRDTRHSAKFHLDKRGAL